MRPSLFLLAFPALLLAQPDKSLEALIERVAKGSDNPVKRSDADAAPRARKRWVWGTSIIQDDTPTAGLPPPGVNANLLSSGAFSVATPEVTLVAPSFPATIIAPPSLPAALVAAATVAPSSAIKKHRPHRVAASSSSTSAPVKRWVIGNSIIQDDSPTSGLPAPGVNVNNLGSGYNAATPTVTVAAPKFTPAAVVPAVAPVVAVPVAAITSAHHRAPAHHLLAKKWIRGPSIIQDGDSAPAEASTPAVTLVAPSFPPPALPLVPVSIQNAVVSSVVSSLSAQASASKGSVPSRSAAVIAALAAEEREALFKLYQKEKHVATRERSTEMDMDLSRLAKKVKRVQ